MSESACANERATRPSRLTPTFGSSTKRLYSEGSRPPSSVTSSSRRGRGCSASSSQTKVAPRSDGSGLSGMMRALLTPSLRLRSKEVLVVDAKRAQASKRYYLQALKNGTVRCVSAGRSQPPPSTVRCMHLLNDRREHKIHCTFFSRYSQGQIKTCTW